MREARPRPPTFTRDRARALRKESTKAERRLWARLRDLQLDGLKFRRQQVIGHYIADFFCADARLVVETDGLSHEVRVDYDEQRDRYLESLGYKVLRFFDSDVLEHTDYVMEAILKAAER